RFAPPWARALATLARRLQASLSENRPSALRHGAGLVERQVRCGTFVRPTVGWVCGTASAPHL
ncbi:MAG: hypothetical protein ACYSWX_13275, partial [Planctomycetota bacterium]